MKRKTMGQLADDCASRIRPGDWWHKPDLVEAFKAGWRASTASRWPKAKVPKRRTRSA